MEMHYRLIKAANQFTFRTTRIDCSFSEINIRYNFPQCSYNNPEAPTLYLVSFIKALWIFIRIKNIPFRQYIYGHLLLKQ